MEAGGLPRLFCGRTTRLTLLIFFYEKIPLVGVPPSSLVCLPVRAGLPARVAMLR